MWTPSRRRSSTWPSSGVSYPNGPDLGTRISPKYRIQGVPESFLVDRQGDIVLFKIAPIGEAELTTELDKALAK